MKNIDNKSFVNDKNIFLSFLALLAWMPLPLASNRIWALSLAELWIFLLSLFLWASFSRGRLRSSNVMISAKPVLYVFLCWLLFLLFQLIPFPVSWVGFISPTRLESFGLLDSTPTWLPLTESVSESSSYFFQSLAYVLLFIMTLVLVNTRSRIKWLAWTIVYSALFQAVYGSLMTLSGLEYGFFIKKIAYLDVATGTFVNRNHLAGYLNMGLALGVGLLISGLSRSSTKRTIKQWSRKITQLLLSGKTQLRVYIALMTIALVLTHSRMGNSAFFIALTVSILIALALTKHARPTMLALVISIIVIDIFILSAWFGLEKVAERIEQTSVKSEQRDEVVLYSLEQWRDYWIVGSGSGTYQYIFPKYRGSDINLYYDHAHNDLLEIATETGLIGISLLVMSVVLSFVTALRALSKRRDPLMVGTAFSVVMAILALSIHSFVDFNLQIPANAATFMVIMALAWVARFHKDKKANY